jgi:hypothetical protein
MAKFADGGSSRLLHGRDLFDLVVAHVGYERGTPEQDLAYRSPMLSFSEDIDAAFGFAERSQSKELEPSTIEDATHFVWQLETPLTPRSPGHYAMQFKTDPVNCEQLVRDQVPRAMAAAHRDGDLAGIARVVGSIGVMDMARQDSSLHYAELVDVVTFVKARVAGRTEVNERLVRNSLTRAARSREWLLYPMDAMADGPGYSSRFPMNQHLRVFGCYRVCGAG